VSEGIPDVSWSMGIAPGAPVMVLGGVWVVVVGVGLEILEILELTELDELREELTGLGFCLSARWRWRALWTG